MARMKATRFVPLLAAVLMAAAPPRIHTQAAPASQKAPAAQAIPAGAPQLVILDTDIGDDIDDAFALGLVLRSPELKLLGVETAYGDTELRARLVDRYLTAVGRRDIPVLAGAKTPAGHFTQAPYARQWPARLHGDAASFLLSEIRAHPGQITLLAIGPLFNVQAAIEKDPATFKQLKRVVLMGGSIHRGYDEHETGTADAPPSAEWNIKCDPAGARALFNAGVPVYVLPLDSTQIPLRQPQLGRLLAYGSPLTDQIALLYQQWTSPQSTETAEWRSPTLFDPVAVTYALRPDLCPAAPMHLEVDDQGFTRPTDGAPNVQVCLHVHAQEFLDFLLGRLAPASAQ